MTLITHLSDIMILSGPLVFVAQSQQLTGHQKETPGARNGGSEYIAQNVNTLIS